VIVLWVFLSSLLLYAFSEDSPVVLYFSRYLCFMPVNVVLSCCEDVVGFCHCGKVIELSLDS